MANRHRIPGPRDVRATLDGSGDADAVVVACPPHPQMGGSRTDARLTAVAEALVDRSVACLRFDYGPWDEGRGEVSDAVAACEWARDRFTGEPPESDGEGSPEPRVGLFGYSFGAGVALLAAAEADPAAVSVLAPPAVIGERDVVAAAEQLARPLQVVYGERDDTVDWRPVVEAAREGDATVDSIGADHHFVGQRARVADLVAAWFEEAL